MSETTNWRIQKLVIPMVRERSREPGDAWDTAAAELAIMTGDGVPSADQIARVIDPHAFDPPDHWTLGNVKAAQKTARDIADRVFAFPA